MWILEILFGIIKLFGGSTSSSSDEPREYNGNDGDGPYQDSPGRWTQNEINIQHNIDMGMAIKDDD